MTKSEFIDMLASRSGMTKAATAEMVQAFTDVVTEELSKGGKVALTGFGTFSVSHRKARTGVNPQTGQPLQIPAANVPKFTAGRNLKDAVRG